MIFSEHFWGRLVLMFSTFLWFRSLGGKIDLSHNRARSSNSLGPRVRKVGMGDDLPLRKVNDFGTWEAKRKSHGGRMMQIASYSERYILPLWGRGQTTAFWEWHFSRWKSYQQKNTNNFLGYLLMFNLVHLFLLKGNCCWRIFFLKIPGWSFIRLSNQGEGNELEAISTSCTKSEG